MKACEDEMNRLLRLSEFEDQGMVICSCWLMEVAGRRERNMPQAKSWHKLIHKRRTSVKYWLCYAAVIREAEESFDSMHRSSLLVSPIFRVRQEH